MSTDPIVSNVASGRAFGFRVVIHGARATPFFTAAITLIAFLGAIEVRDKIVFVPTIAAMGLGAVLCYRSWKNPLYRNIRWLLLAAALFGMGTWFGGWGENTVLVQRILNAATILAVGVCLPLFPNCRPIEPISNAETLDG